MELPGLSARPKPSVPELTTKRHISSAASPLARVGPVGHTRAVPSLLDSLSVPVMTKMHLMLAAPFGNVSRTRATESQYIFF